MTRVALYARYSSDAQSEKSIEDQVRICRTRADREGWSVGEVYADYAISGASASRPRFQQLIIDAHAGRFDVTLAEALDRLSRDQEHIAGFYKQMSFAGVRVVTLAEGEISELHIGLKGTMSALFLKDLSQKTHRGLEGRVRAGGSGGGLSYGYQVRRGLRPDGTMITGELEIDEAESATVRRVFAAYAGGQSPRSIAKLLNTEGVAGPRSGKWTASLLLGGVDRETGMLRNRLYIGERVWNRQHYVKDPSTGRRVARLNPRESWVTTAVPQLAIVDPEIWRAAQARLTATRLTIKDPANAMEAQPINRGARMAAARRPTWPLSGLVRCGVCNGPMSVMGSNGRLGCANRFERGTCSNPRTLLRDVLLPRVLVGLKERLLAPELIEEFVRVYVAEVNAANREIGSRQAGLQQQQAKLTRQIRNLLELLKEGHGGPAMAAELREMERRQEELAREIVVAGTPEVLPVLHPNLPALYRRRIEALEEALAEPSTAISAAEALRDLVSAVLIFPGERRGKFTVTLRGDLAAFLHASGRPPADNASNSKTPAIRGDSGRSEYGPAVLGTWDAGTRKHLDLLLA